MNFKYIFVLIFVLIISVGAVCAEGDTDTDSNVDTDVDVDVPGSEFVIDDSNYDTYFDTDGHILETANITDGDTIKFGDVTNKTFVFDKSLTITSNSSDNAMNNSFISFVNGSDGSNVFNLTLSYEDVTKTTITIDSVENITFSHNIIFVNAGENGDEDEMYAILAVLSDNLVLTENNIAFIGKSNGSKSNSAIKVIGSDSVVFKNNIVHVEIPSTDIDWVTSTVFSEGVSFEDCDNLTFENNRIDVNATEIIGNSTYDSIYVVHIVNSTGSAINNNTISAYGDSSRMYGLVISSEDFSITNNNITLMSDVLQTNALEIGGVSSGEVANNTLTSLSSAFAYGIDTWMSDINVTYLENIIDVSADVAYGVELMGNEEYFVKNRVNVSGNSAIGLASCSKELAVSENAIFATGNNSASDIDTQDLFGAVTTGITLYNSSATIFDNTITSSVTGMKVEGGKVFVSNNTIAVESNQSNNDSFGILGLETLIEIVQNNIIYTAYSNGSVVTDAILLSESPNSVIFGNEFDISIPSIPVNYDFYPEIITYSEGIAIYESDNITISNNSIELECNSAPINTSNLDTIYVINVVDSIANITSNDITAEGNNYIYGIKSSKGGEINDNTVNIESKYYSTGINLESDGTFEVIDNSIISTSEGIAYGIYSQKYYGKELNATYANNVIYAEAPIVYAARLSGSKEQFAENKVTGKGNFVMGVGSDSDNVSFELNRIDVQGSNEEVEIVSFDTIGVETVGIKVNNTSLIVGNDIDSTGEFAVNINESASSVYDNHLVSALLFGDDSVYSVNDSASVYNNTPDYDAFIDINNTDVYYNSNSSVYATLHTINGTPIADKNLTFIIDDEEYNVTTDENGTASVPIDLPVGDYKVTVHFKPGENYTEVVEESPLYVHSTVDSEDVEKLYGNDVVVDATFFDTDGNPVANGTNVTFTVGNETSVVPTDENGTASITLSNLTSGEHEVNITNPVTNETITTTVTVDPTVTSEGLEKLYKDSTPFEATFVDSEGNPLVNETVQFEVNGITYNRTTNENGTAKLNINLLPGDYVITSTNPSNNETVKTNITVKSTIISSDIVKYFKNDTQYLATFLDEDGNPLVNETVSFNVNGVIYQRKTNENGTAKLNINLPAGNCTVSATNPVNNQTVSNNIEVLPVLTANDLTKKYGAADQFVAHVLDGQGKALAGATVTFNINGVLYNRVTDSNGDARLNIRLPQGKYIITSMYNGAGISNTITVTG